MVHLLLSLVVISAELSIDPERPTGINHGIEQDGRVAVLTVKEY